MTQPATLCPNCGGPVLFRWSSSVQTTCEHCRSILVRTDLNLELVGSVADLPLDSSPIQIGTEGRYQGRSFTVAGRIIYSYSEGSWNEWHVVFGDGSSGWLSDAQSRYAVTFRIENERLPVETAVSVGKVFNWQGTEYTVTTITLAHYRGVQGELPFPYWDKDVASFADMSSASGKFATLDYSDGEAALYVGEMVDFDALMLRNLKEAQAAPGAKTQGLNCPGCGAAITLRALEKTVTVVCGTCHAVLDAADPKLTILQRYKGKTQQEEPLIPLGSRGKWRGTDYDVIGFQKRVGNADGETFSWREYVLFNLKKGFRYFTEYNGHWNDATPVSALPQQQGNRVQYLANSYAHFQTVTAHTGFVLGEFPWQVRVGDEVEVADYIAPPYVLSSEKTGSEVTWTLGEYVYGKDIWKAFGLPGVAPKPVGVFENQPSPARLSMVQIWSAFAVFASLVLIIFMVNESLAAKEEVFKDRYSFRQNAGSEASFVTPIFQLKGRTSSVELRTDAAVANQWIYLNYALINADTGQAYDVGREVSLYSGYDSDGPWSEGRQDDEVLLPSVPSGRYYVRVEPESEARLGNINYSLTVTRDVPSYALYLYALGALLVPAILIAWRTFNFEQMRWAESDHPLVKGST
jgi:hypothetical protein